MQNAIKQEIKRLSKRTFTKAERIEKTEIKFRKRFKKRTGRLPGIPSPRTKVFKHRHFDPIYCARNANFLAKTIWNKICTQQYEVTPAVKFDIDKPNGDKRTIMAFSIPDAAVANVILRRCRDRNLKRLSPSSFAYLPNKNLFDAILELKSYSPTNKLFAVQIDFEKYFDLIPVTYITDIISDRRKISVTPQESYVFGEFLTHRFADSADYMKGKFRHRHRGTPQGSSVSLLLANLANNDLDISLSSKAGKFVRFADDVVALCNTYEEAQIIEKCFFDHCERSSLRINREKSPGIAVISKHPQEVRSDSHFDYLGYRFCESGLTIPDKSVIRLKSKISRLINLYLLQYLNLGFNKFRAETNPHSYDWDLLGLIYELRLSLYGGLSERKIESFINNEPAFRSMRGLMGFYCLLEDSARLKELDGWMLSMTRRALVKRNIILHRDYHQSCPTPSNKELATGEWLDMHAWRGTDYPDARMPSLVRGWRAARKYFYSYGLEDVDAPTYRVYTDIGKLFDYH